MSELLPCPFCGGEAQTMKMDLSSIEEGLQVWGVWCLDDLHAEDRGDYQHGHFIDNYATEAEAIEAWNTRHERECEVVNHGSPYGGVPLLQCSRCDGLFYGDATGDIPNYCPNCGAKVIAP